MTITRIDSGPRMSEAVIHNGTVYLSGQVGEGDTVTAQTIATLAEIEALLRKAGSSKHHLLQVTIWLADMDDFAEMNAVWDAWVADIAPPARATGEARLAAPEYRVEMIVTAALAG